MAAPKPDKKLDDGLGFLDWDSDIKIDIDSAIFEDDATDSDLFKLPVSGNES